MREKEDLTGRIFGKLTVIGFGHMYKSHTFWNCVCECGKTKTIRAYSLTSGKTLSCGCYRNSKTVFVKGHAYGKTTQFQTGNTFSKSLHLAPGWTPGNTLPSGTALYHQYIKDAKRRNIEFDLGIETFTSLTKSNCKYCGIEPSNQFYKKNKGLISGMGYMYNGLDRVDSSKGYVTENVVPCCWKCNQAKSNYSKDDFLDWVKRVYEHSLTNTKECATIE